MQTLASRYEFSSQAVEDRLGRHMPGKRLSDGAQVMLTVLDPLLNIGPGAVCEVVGVSRRLSELMSPSVLLCLEAGRTEGGNLYILHEGTSFDSLRALLKARGTLSPAEAISVAWQLAAVLRAAHGIGVEHLDLSSSNVFVDLSSGAVRVARYGFSRLLPAYSPMRRNEPYLGTAEYMAPEVCSGRPGDHLSDLYAVGILMYEMVAGKPPFVSSSPSTTIKRQVYEKPLPLHLVKPGLPKLDAYEKVVSKLLSKDPKARYQEATELMEALAALRAEAFNDARLELEPARSEVPEISCSLEEETAPLKTEPASAATGVSKETMAFTGLAAAVEALAASAARVEAAPTSREFESRPTEAFDPSLAIEAARAASEARPTPAPEPVAEPGPSVAHVPAPEPAVAAPEPTPEQPTAEQPTAEQPTAEQPTAEQPTAQLGGAPAEPAAQTVKKPEDWFVEGGQLPESALPEDHEVVSERRWFWGLLVGVGLLLVLGVVVWYEASLIRGPEPPVEKVSQEEVAPVVTPPTPAPELVTAEQVRLNRIRGLVSRGRQEFAAGNLDAARKVLEEVLAEDPENGDARTLLSAVTVKMREAAAPPPQPTPEPRPEPPVAKPAPEVKPTPEPRVAKPAPQPKPTPRVTKPEPQPPSEEQVEELRKLIKAGREAYNRQDYTAAISAYNKALALDPNNALVQKLLEQAKAKMGQ